MSAPRNGVNGVSDGGTVAAPVRFSDVPSAIEVPVQGDDQEEAVEIDLIDLGDDPFSNYVPYSRMNAPRSPTG